MASWTMSTSWSRSRLLLLLYTFDEGGSGGGGPTRCWGVDTTAGKGRCSWRLLAELAFEILSLYEERRSGWPNLEMTAM